MSDNEKSSDKQAEQAAALAKAFAGSCETERDRLARIVDLLPCYVAVVDKQRRILFHNKTFEEYFGAPGTARCHESLRGQEKECSFCPPFQALESNGTSVMEWIAPKSKHAFRVYSYPFEEMDGTPCVLKVGFNITSSVRVQQALDLSEQSYRAITDNLSIGIALLDVNLRIKAGNIRLSQWFADEFRLDRSICEIVQCADRKPGEGPFTGDPATCADCPLYASLMDGSGHEKELAVTFEDGREHMVRLVTCPVKPGKSAGSQGNKVRAIIMMLEDITTRLRVNQQLQRARKLETMSTLAGGIAHEINQPLSALHLYASGLQMLLEKKQDGLPAEVTLERLSLIMREAEKIRSIISHMRALVMREGHVSVSAVSIASSVASVLTLMKSQLHTRAVIVETSIPPDLPLVRSNVVQLEQVLVNLLANAMHALDTELSHSAQRYAREGRRISIRAYMRPPQRDESPRIRLEVADNGPGLPKGSERIFDPFYTTKERHEGMGLGLSIVYGLVSLWGGEISAAPHHPQLGGAAFYVDLHPADSAETIGDPLEIPVQDDNIAGIE